VACKKFIFINECILQVKTKKNRKIGGGMEIYFHEVVNFGSK
jgi:hypothetical protein